MGPDILTVPLPWVTLSDISVRLPLLFARMTAGAQIEALPTMAACETAVRPIKSMESRSAFLSSIKSGIISEKRYKTVLFGKDVSYFDSFLAYVYHIGGGTVVKIP